MTDRPPLQDPRKQYPAPPFPEQPQPMPGLALRMDPVPDHGEESYRGSGRLHGRKALVTGGEGLVELEDPKAVAKFIESCRKLRLWSREMAVKL